MNARHDVYELIRSMRQTIERNYQLREQIAVTAEKLRVELLERELARLTILLEKVEGDLGQLTRTESSQRAVSVPSPNRWLETYE